MGDATLKLQPREGKWMQVGLRVRVVMDLSKGMRRRLLANRIIKIVKAPIQILFSTHPHNASFYLGNGPICVICGCLKRGAMGVIQIYWMLKYSTRGYDQPELTQSALDINPRKNKFLSSTGFTNQPLNSTKLPQLSRSVSSSKSTKLKLTTIEATLSAISQQLHDLKLDTRQSRRFANYLKDELGQSQLGSRRLQLQTNVNKLQKMFKLSKKHDEDRSHQIKLDCDHLKESSRKLVGMVSLLQDKVDNCERVMGIYSGKEKHRV